jgi:hypothetical protein
VRFIYEQDEVWPFLQLADQALNSILEHAAQHGAGNHRIHLQIDDLAITQTDRHAIGFVLDAPRQAFGNCRLPYTRLADQHHRIGALAMAENFEHLLNLVVAAEYRGNLILTSQQVQIRREMLQEWRELEPLLEPLFPQFDIPQV